MNRADHDRGTIERARYLAASTDLSEREALALAYREQGFSASGIADETGSRIAGHAFVFNHIVVHKRRHRQK